MRRVAVAILGCLLACAVDAGRNETGSMPCTVGTVTPCTCADGAASTATCGVDGIFGACMCQPGTDAGTANGSESGGESSSSSGAASGDTTSATSTGCDGSIYADRVMDVPALWSMGGQTGLAAGALMCASVGADHVCDYDEVKQAEEAGELAGMVNFTAWIHRTTIESVDGVPSAPSPGGRCVDWTYDMDVLADGEWVDFTSDGPVYHLDPDTFYDGLDGSHADPAALPCAATTRAVLCCNAAC